MTEPLKEKTDVLLRLFEEGKQFTSELLRENERLRLLIAGQKAEGQAMKKAGSDGGPHDPDSDQKVHQRELEELKRVISELERENREFADKFVKVEQQNQSMASLYVSSYRLHSTLDFKEVINIIKEIIINLIGSEAFGLFLKDPDRNELGLVSHEGLENMKISAIPIGHGIAGRAAETGESYVSEKKRDGDAKNPLACIPLKVQDSVIGLIVIYGLLRQKDGFAPVDLELFALLADHAATAIYCSQLHGNSERKLNTMQNLLELLKSDP